MRSFVVFSLDILKATNDYRERERERQIIPRDFLSCTSKSESDIVINLFSFPLRGL